MASYTITGFSTTPQTLANAQSGFVGQDAEHVVSTGPAIDGAGTNYVTLNGSVVTQDTGWPVYDFDGSTMNLYIGPRAMVNAANADTIQANATTLLRVYNNGTIFSGEDALDLRTSDTATNIRVTNNGDILAESDGMYLNSGNGSIEVINNGFVSGQDGVGIILDPGTSGSAILRNAGTVAGETMAVTGDNQTDDIIYNSGTFMGDVHLYSGDDLYDGRGGGIVQGNIVGGNGNDILNGGKHSDILIGDANDDIIRGRGGDDFIDGGTGRDILRGGGGDDTFYFNSTSDSVNSSNSDVIRGFKRGDDTIDLSDLTVGDLEWRGGNNYNLGNPGVKYGLTAAGNTLLYIDTNGDAITDMRIQVNGVTYMSEADFLL